MNNEVEYLDEWCDCTGDACVGDYVQFTRDILERVAINRFGKLAWKKVDEEYVRGVIIKDSYGAAKQQHTFTLLLANGSKRLVKGRVMYRNGCSRRKWKDESEREKILSDKHERGNAARSARSRRVEEEESHRY